MPTELGNLKELQELYFHNNPYLFGKIPSEELAGLSKLNVLTLNGTSVTGVLPNEVCDITLLQVDCAVDGNGRTGLCGCECDCSTR